MNPILAACGNDCSICPRFMPKTEAQLKSTAELWYKIGYRDHLVDNEEIKCNGCTTDNWCRHGIVGCTSERQLENCGQCEDYPCPRIKEAFENTAKFIPDCRKCCTDEEFQIMKKAFFEKKKNLNDWHEKCKQGRK